MSMIKGKRFHFEGEDSQGGAVFSECSKDGEPVVVRAERVESGKPLRYAQNLVQIKQTEDGEHYEMEEVIGEPGGKGPAMVSSKDYRAGWERTFGNNGVN